MREKPEGKKEKKLSEAESRVVSSPPKRLDVVVLGFGFSFPQKIITKTKIKIVLNHYNLISFLRNKALKERQVR